MENVEGNYVPATQKFLPNLTTFQTLAMKYSKSEVSELEMKTVKPRRAAGVSER